MARKRTSFQGVLANARAVERLVSRTNLCRMSRGALIAIGAVLILCLTIDILDGRRHDPQVPALFYGLVVSVAIWGVDRYRRHRRNRRTLGRTF